MSIRYPRSGGLCVGVHWLAVLLLLPAAGCAGLMAPSRETQARRKHVQEAAREFDQRRDEAELLSARELCQRGAPAQACETLHRLLARNPGHAEARKLLDEIKAAENASAESGNAAKPAFAVFSSYDEKADGRGVPPEGGPLLPVQEALRRGDMAGAQAAIDALVRANPHDPQIPISAAVLLLRYNQAQRAIRLLDASAQAHPHCSALHRLQGAAYYRLGDYKGAQVAFRQALSLDKSSALSYFLMGCTLAKLGQDASAEAHFQQAEMLDPRYGVEH